MTPEQQVLIALSEFVLAHTTVPKTDPYATGLRQAVEMLQSEAGLGGSGPVVAGENWSRMPRRQPHSHEDGLDDNPHYLAPHLRDMHGCIDEIQSLDRMRLHHDRHHEAEAMSRERLMEEVLASPAPAQEEVPPLFLREREAQAMQHHLDAKAEQRQKRTPCVWCDSKEHVAYDCPTIPANTPERHWEDTK